MQAITQGQSHHEKPLHAQAKRPQELHLRSAITRAAASTSRGTGATVSRSVRAFVDACEEGDEDVHIAFDLLRQGDLYLIRLVLNGPQNLVKVEALPELPVFTKQPEVGEN